MNSRLIILANILPLPTTQLLPLKYFLLKLNYDETISVGRSVMGRLNISKMFLVGKWLERAEPRVGSPQVSNNIRKDLNIEFFLI